MRQVPIMVNGSTFTPDDFNPNQSENENIVTSTGQVLDEMNDYQLAIAAAIYASTGDFYVDSGTANTYVLSVVGALKAPDEYKDGMTVRFKAINANTGASTVNTVGLGIKNIKNRDGSALQSNEIGLDDYVELTYEQANGYFVITSRTDVSNNIPYGMAVESSSNVYTLNLGGIYNIYDHRMFFRCQFPTNNTGSITLNIDSIGAKAVVDNGNGIALSGGEIALNKEYLISYSEGSANLRIQSRITATNTEVKTGTSQTLDITPSAMIHHTMIPKMRGYFDATVTPLVVHESKNCSIIDNGVGKYTISFATNLTNTYYQVLTTCDQLGTGGWNMHNAHAVDSSRSVSSVDLRCFSYGDSTNDVVNADGKINFVIFGDL